MKTKLIKCSFSNCNEIAVGEAFFARTKDKWHPKCKIHLEILKKNGMKTRLFTDLGKVKILCHSCEGSLFIEEIAYETRNPVKVSCPECDGIGYVLYEPFIVVSKQREDEDE